VRYGADFNLHYVGQGTPRVQMSTCTDLIPHPDPTVRYGRGGVFELEAPVRGAFEVDAPVGAIDFNVRIPRGENSWVLKPTKVLSTRDIFTHFLE
jgi:hypothetical protein